MSEPQSQSGLYLIARSRYFIRIREAMDLILPVEHLIVDGVLSPDKLSELDSCVASAMTTGEVTLIAVTPMVRGRPMSLGLHGASSGAYTLVDLGTGKTVASSSNSHVSFTAALNRSTLLRLAPASPNNIPA